MNVIQWMYKKEQVQTTLSKIIQCQFMSAIAHELTSPGSNTFLSQLNDPFQPIPRISFFLSALNPQLNCHATLSRIEIGENNFFVVAHKMIF